MCMVTFIASSTDLHANDHSVEIQDGLPVLPQNVQADVTLQIDIGVVDLLCALDLWRVMGEILIDIKRKVEDSTLVHAFVRFDTQSEVENVVGVGEVHFHCVSEGEFREI